MDFSYDWLSAQIRHDLNKFLLFFIAYFPCFGPNKKNPKCRNKLNLTVSTCRSIGCPSYQHWFHTMKWRETHPPINRKRWKTMTLLSRRMISHPSLGHRPTRRCLYQSKCLFRHTTKLHETRTRWIRMPTMQRNLWTMKINLTTIQHIISRRQPQQPRQHPSRHTIQLLSQRTTIQCKATIT